jgi:ferrochelatase
MEGKNEFLKAGGTHFQYVPCLNTDDRWVSALNKWVQEIDAGEDGRLFD